MLLRGIWYRAGRSAAVALLAAVAVAAAVLAPAYGRAAEQSVLTDRLAVAPASATGLTVTASGTAGAAPAAHEPIDEARLAVDAALAAHPTLSGVLGEPVAGADTDTVVSGGTEPNPPEQSSAAADEAGRMAARLAYRDGVCGQLAVSGDCPAGPGEVLVSDRTAEEYRIGPGDRVTVRFEERSTELLVVGTYTPSNPAAAYWGRSVYFTHGGFDPASGAPRVDAIFTGDPADVLADPTAVVNLGLAYPLRTVRLDDVSDLRADLRALPTIGEREVVTDLPAILDDAARDQDAIRTAAPVIAIPLLLLACFVLYLLVAAVTEERGREIALAKLRGYPGGRAARFGLGEVLVLIVGAAPIGIALGLGAAELAARAALAEGSHVALRWPVLAAATGALAAAALAAWLAGRATLRTGVLDLLRRVPRRGRWRAGLVEGVVVALAAASLVVAVGDPSAPLALLAPALLAVVAGVATARLVRWWSRRGRFRGRIPRLLASAALARRPGGQRVIALVTVAVGLLSFAAFAWDAAAAARHDHATDALGADRVYTVHADHPAALLEAVADQDAAMAVVRASGQYAADPVELLAVQSSRLAEVTQWRGQDRATLDSLAERLRPAGPAPLYVDGRIEVAARVRELGAEPVRLTALVAGPGGPPRVVPLGTLDRGTEQYGADLPGCDAGCRLLGLGLGRTAAVGLSGDACEPDPDRCTATVEIGSIRSGGGELAVGFDDPRAWPEPPGTAVTRGSSLTVEISGGDAGDVMLEHWDTPPALPVVLAGDAPAEDPAASEFRFPDLSDQPEPFTVVDRVGRLPRAGEHGLLFDLAYATSTAERSVALADLDGLRYEVWVSPAAPADLPQRLAERGVSVQGTESMAGMLDRLGRGAPALGLWLYLLAAAAAVALALGTVALTTWIGVAARRYDLAALRATGVPARLLRRAVAREYAMLLGWPLLVGAAVGVATAALMLPGIPLVVTGDAGGAAYPGWPGMLAAALAVTVAGLALAALRALRLPGRASADRLREGAP